METVYQHSDHEDENQVLLFIRRTALTFFESCIIVSLTAMHYFFLPAILVYSFWAYALEQTWQITKQISNEIFELMKIVPLTFELWFWSALIFLQVVFFFKKVEEATIEVEKKVYGKSKEILRKLNVFPLSTQNAAALYSFMMRIPIFGKNRLPFPKFLFEDTFTKIQFRKGVISMTVPSPSHSSQLGTETSASVEPSTSVIPPPILLNETEPEAVDATVVNKESATKAEEKPNPADSSSVQEPPKPVVKFSSSSTSSGSTSA